MIRYGTISDREATYLEEGPRIGVQICFLRGGQRCIFEKLEDSEKPASTIAVRK